MSISNDINPQKKTIDLSNSWRLGYFDNTEIQEYYCMRANQLRFRQFQQKNSHRLHNHFYITVVPNTLDLLEYCLDFLPDSLNVFLIANGLEPWEQSFIEKTYPHIPVFTLTTRGKSIIYDRILDLLVENNQCNFGVLDQDCFVIDRGFFKKIRLKRDTFVFSPFVTTNAFAKITFPRTYFLYFNTELIKQIRNRYRLSFKRCWKIPAHLEERLMNLQLGYDNFPHNSLRYFDNFQLIWATAMADNYSFTTIRNKYLFVLPNSHKRSRIVHIGSGHSYIDEAYRDNMIQKKRNYDKLTKLEREKLSAAAFSHYAHLLLLENSENEELRSRYLGFFSVYKNSGHVAELFGPLITRDNISKMDIVIKNHKRRWR